MQLTDALGRQLRWRQRNPKGSSPQITNRVLDIFEINERHGYASSKYLHSLIGGELNTFQKLLSRLYDWGYLDHFDEQEQSFPNRLRHIIYGNNQKARDELRKADRATSFIDRNDTFVHRFMGGCVGISIEAACRERGLKYLSRNVVLSKKNNPIRIPLPRFGEKAYLEPDDLFGIQYPDGSYRRYAIEIDRGNEPIEGTKRHSSIEKKLDYYHDVIANRRYHDVWGIPGLMLLFVTTSALRAHNIMKFTNKLRDERFTSRLLAKSYTDFGSTDTDWLVPDALLTDILDPWQRPDGTTFDISRP